MKIPAKIFKMRAKTYEQGSSKIFAENREDLGQNFWNIEKEKVGGRPAKLNEKKSHIELEREIKKERGHHFFIGRTTWKFCSGGEKMRNASGHRGEKERQWKKKQTNKQTEQEHTRRFLEVSRRSRAKQRHRNVQKVCCTCGVAFSLIRPLVVFLRFSLLLPPSITRFFISFEQTIIINYREIRLEPWLNLYITLY